jgi:GTPase Era involved in 16S rRNA processing
MHPGWVDTAGVQTALPAFRATLRRALRNADQGADTILWLIDQQPAMSSKGGIWLDRHLDDEHAFALTRQSRWTAADLYDRLEDTARGVLA